MKRAIKSAKTDDRMEYYDVDFIGSGIVCHLEMYVKPEEGDIDIDYWFEDTYNEGDELENEGVQYTEYVSMADPLDVDRAAREVVEECIDIDGSEGRYDFSEDDVKSVVDAINEIIHESVAE